jgi:hypothetical protein
MGSPVRLPVTVRQDPGLWRDLKIQVLRLGQGRKPAPAGPGVERHEVAVAQPALRVVVGRGWHSDRLRRQFFQWMSGKVYPTYR